MPRGAPPEAAKTPEASKTPPEVAPAEEIPAEEDDETKDLRGTVYKCIEKIKGLYHGISHC